MRGVPIASHKGEWKQDSPKKNVLEEVKEAKRSKMEDLGFSGSHLQMGSSIQDKERHGKNILPEIRQSRKNAQAFKPAAFSIYSIMKTNEVFTNNPA